MRRGQRTEGQKHLLRLTRQGSQDAIALACGVSQSVVSLWISGKRKPTYENRVVLEKQYKIALDAWDRIAEVMSIS